MQVRRLAEEYNEYLRKDGNTSFVQKTRKVASHFKGADLSDTEINRTTTHLFALAWKKFAAIFQITMLPRKMPKLVN
jgi:hypothetical protein